MLVVAAGVVVCGLEAAASARAAVQPAAQAIAPGQPFLLAIGGSAVAQGPPPLEFRFDSVTEDSRCPIGVTCVWAGDAVVRLIVTGSREPLLLHTNEGYDTSVSVGSYEIRLAGLTPPPEEGSAIDPASYRAELILTQVD